MAPSFLLIMTHENDKGRSGKSALPRFCFRFNHKIKIVYSMNTSAAIGQSINLPFDEWPRSKEEQKRERRSGGKA